LVGGKTTHYIWFGTGGAEKSRIFRSADGGQTWTAADTPLPAGKASAGIFSLMFLNQSEGHAVGGDYTANSLGVDGIRTRDGGLSWQAASHGPYLSCVTEWSVGGILRVGPAPTESGEPKDLNACASGNPAWVVGQHGAIYRTPAFTTMEKR